VIGPHGLRGVLFDAAKVPPARPSFPLPRSGRRPLQQALPYQLRPLIEENSDALPSPRRHFLP
jgi:hypothetical protein